MRTPAAVGLVLIVAASSLAAQADTMKKATPKSCCAGMDAGGMQRGGGMMGGMDHMRMGQMGMGQGGMGDMGGMMGPMGKVLAFDPEHLLAAKDKLQLTEQQVTRLTALRDAGKKTADAAHQPAHAAMEGLMKELDAAAPDTTKVRQLFMAHGTGMANVTWAKASTAFQARALLTELQRGRVEGMHDAMQGGRMMQHDGMQGGHMMQHDGMQGMEHPAKP